jgi:hypothetical protein
VNPLHCMSDLTFYVYMPIYFEQMLIDAQQARHLALLTDFDSHLASLQSIQLHPSLAIVNTTGGGCDEGSGGGATGTESGSRHGAGDADALAEIEVGSDGGVIKRVGAASVGEGEVSQKAELR